MVLTRLHFKDFLWGNRNKPPESPNRIEINGTILEFCFIVILIKYGNNGFLLDRQLGSGLGGTKSFEDSGLFHLSYLIHYLIIANFTSYRNSKIQRNCLIQAPIYTKCSSYGLFSQ